VRGAKGEGGGVGEEKTGGGKKVEAGCGGWLGGVGMGVGEEVG